MRDLFIKIFSNETLGPEIKLFGFWHILYTLLIIVGAITLALLINKKDIKYKTKVLNILSIIILVLYFGDFFIQPFYNNDNLIIDKLPFHLCTFLGLVIAYVRFGKHGEKIKSAVSVLALVASTMYLTYPGSAIGDISCFSYKVIQTFLFHGAVFMYGLISLSSGEVRLDYKKVYIELIIICIIALWAQLGNTLYSTSSHPYDWFFISGITFPFLPKPLMPFMVIIIVYSMVNIIYLIYFGIKKYNEKRKIIKEKA